MLKKVAAAWLLCVAIALAQTDRGSIRGTITDQSSAIIPGALVTVTSVEPGVASTAKSGDHGTYNVGALPPGIYRVDAAQDGFKSLRRDNVVVSLGNVTGLDLKLEIGNSAQTVTINEAAPILKTEQSSTATEVSVEAFNDLPLSAGGGRGPQNFKYLTPGVNNNNSINGSPQLSGQVTMEGISVQNAEVFGADINVRFPPEAVGEMSVITSAY
ncbi:MAG: carboxypeptidase-like regulatory domain-containing protein, partial [Bryobacteraceae bacterium]